MDPNECLCRMLRACQTNDRETAEEAAEDLATWLRQGGFFPAVTEQEAEFVKDKLRNVFVFHVG